MEPFVDCTLSLFVSFQEKMQALYDFAPNDKEELELKRGDIIVVVEKTDPNWWTGEITRNNQVCRGAFPVVYCKPYTSE